MAAIVNARDLILQAAAVRVEPIPIPISSVEGLTAALKGVRITSTATSFIGSSGTTTPASITLTAERFGGVTGPVVWSVLSGSGTVTPSGDTCSVTGSTVTGQSITLRARVTDSGINYDAQIVLTKLGTLSGQGAVNLATQITGQLANGNVSGLGALALLGSVSLNNNTQVVGSLAADRIGVGTLAAGVIYAGTVNVDNLVGTTISGKNISGASVIYCGGGNQFGPIVMQGAGISGAYPYTAYVQFNGTTIITSERSGGGVNSLTVSTATGIKLSGDTLITGNDIALQGGNINLSGTFTGTLGNRVILKGVTYNVEVNGSPGTTVKFT